MEDSAIDDIVAIRKKYFLVDCFMNREQLTIFTFKG